MEICIDTPRNCHITSPRCQIVGWCALSSRAALGRLYFTLGGLRVPHTLFKRADVAERYPGQHAAGFRLECEIVQHLPAIVDHALVLTAVPFGELPEEIRFTFGRGVISGCLERAAWT